MWGTLRELLVITALCCIVTAGGVGPVAGTAGGQLQEEPPLADAGLDQTVPLGATVYLDGGGSLDPDGSLVAFEWTVETPSGTATAHDCLDADCVQASFDPTQTGVYAVTLTVTDDDGQTASDTLYVTVSEEEPPSVTLTGPDTLQVGEVGTFELRGERGDNFLSAVTWRVDGDRKDRFFVGEDRIWEFTRTFDQTGTYSVSGTLSDVIGLSATAQQTVQVQSNATNRFEVSLSTNSPVLEGDTATVTATIENTGENAATQEIVYEGPPENAERMVTLDGNDSTTETFQWETESGDAGEYPVAVSSRNDTATGTLDVLNETAETPYFAVNITATNSPIEPGEDAALTANITNTGGKTNSTSITATFAPATFPNTTVLTLAPGESKDLDFSFATSDSIDPGAYPVNVSTDDQSDEEDIIVKDPGEADIRVTNLTAGEQPWPAKKDGGMDFSATVKNVGDAPGEDTVKLRLPGEDLTIAKAEVDLAAPPEGGSCSSVTDDCATILDNKNWTFVDVPGTADGKWAPDGENGWWKYSHKDRVMYSLKPSTETGTHDDNSYQLFMPELPQFTIDAQAVTEEGGGNGVQAYGVEVTVTNTGYYEGTAHVTARQTESLYEDHGSAPCDDCELIDLDRSLNPGGEKITLAPGESHSFDSDEFVVSTIHGFQQIKEDLKYKVEVGPSGPWAQEDPHEEEELEDSWEWEPPDPPPEEGEYDCGDVWIEADRYQARNGNEIEYVVKGVKCTEEDEDPEEGELTVIDSSNYQASKTGNSEGDDYTVTEEYVSVDKAEVDDDGFQADWTINVNSGYFNGASDGAGASWLPRKDGP
jgi:hypothetical protein